MPTLLRWVCQSAILFPAWLAAQQPTPGTYRVWLCERECAVADSARAVASAIVVIVDDSTAAAEATRAAFSALRAIRRTGETAGHDNVCFRGTSRARQVGDEELFFGIHPAVATRWRYDPGVGFSVRVYVSPDAGYTLRWSTAGPLSSGEGWSRGWQAHVGDHRNAFFAATRLGPSDIAQCLG